LKKRIEYSKLLNETSDARKEMIKPDSNKYKILLEEGNSLFEKVSHSRFLQKN
jgi:hypothetical protein